MNVEGNCSTSEKGENKTHLPAFLPRPQDTQRHLILCTRLLQTPHISIFHIFALAYRKTAPIFQQTLCSYSQSTHSRALSRQKVGLIFLVVFLPGPSILQKNKVWSDWYYCGPLAQKLFVFYIYLTVKYPVLSFCQTTGTEHFARANLP